MFVSGIVQILFIISYIFTNANHFGSYTCYKVLAKKFFRFTFFGYIISNRYRFTSSFREKNTYCLYMIKYILKIQLLLSPNNFWFFIKC